MQRLWLCYRLELNVTDETIPHRNFDEFRLVWTHIDCGWRRTHTIIVDNFVLGLN